MTRSNVQLSLRKYCANLCVNINYSTNKCWLIHFDSCCRLCWTKAQRMQRMLNLKTNSQVNNTRAQHYGLMQAKSLQSSVIYLIEYRTEADLWLTVTYPSGEQNSTIDRVSWNKQNIICEQHFSLFLKSKFKTYLHLIVFCVPWTVYIFAVTF